MKRLVFGVAVLAFAACSDLPTQPPLDVSPQFATVVGSGATWFFEGTVYYSSPSSPAAVGDTVEGKVTFTIDSGDLMPDDPCTGYRAATSAFTYMVGGQVDSLAGPGVAVSYTSCHPTAPRRIQINATPYPNYWAVELYNTADSEDFPLTPPSPDMWPNVFSMSDGAGAYFGILLSEIYSGPQTKADCMKDGWAKYGFKNQGQCVRYIETGKDSR